MNPTDESSFHTERKNTNKSLGVERESTNRFIKNAKENAEQKTDDRVQEERRSSDLKKSAARTKTDAGVDNGRTANERKVTDAAVEHERVQVDKAIDQERETKGQIDVNFLSNERKQTDQNLEVERIRTDSVVMTTSFKLTSEFAEHVKTKHSLTTRDEFLAIVSHDLRNPIGNIASYMEMLLEEATERNIDPETKSWLERSKRNADVSLRLINDILDMERMAEGKLNMSIARHDIGSIIREVVDNYVYSADSKKVRLISAPEGIKLDVDCDRDRMHQILSNLIGNALKFTPEYGEIVLKVESATKNVTVSIKDTGPGIPDEKKTQIFEKYAQLKSKDRTGLGLGLHISKMLVEAHGGNLWVESTPGTGSTFTFQLPLLTSEL